MGEKVGAMNKDQNNPGILGIQSDSILLTIFLPNAGTVLLTLEHLGSSKPVTHDTSRDARVALGAAFNSKKTR